MRCEAKTTQSRVSVVKKAMAWCRECSENGETRSGTGTGKRRKSSESHWKSSDLFVYGRVVFENDTPRMFVDSPIERMFQVTAH